MLQESPRSLGLKGSAEGAGPVGDSFEQFVIDFRESGASSSEGSGGSKMGLSGKK